MVPSGKATTVCPARSRAATAPTTSGKPPQAGPLDRDDLHQARGDTRAPGQLISSALATKDPGITAPIEKMSTHDTWPLTTSTPRRLRIGPPDTVIRTPRRAASAGSSPAGCGSGPAAVSPAAERPTAGSPRVSPGRRRASRRRRGRPLGAAPAAYTARVAGGPRQPGTVVHSPSRASMVMTPSRPPSRPPRRPTAAV